MRLIHRRCHRIVSTLAFGVFLTVTFSNMVGTNAQEKPSNVVIPPERTYLFSLPWCKRWTFSCNECERTGDGIACTKIDWKRDCTETFNFYYCSRFDPPADCVRWSDGCNTCQRIQMGSALGQYCTLLACEHYLAPNRPIFECRATGKPIVIPDN
jgi:hypothetical protein